MELLGNIIQMQKQGIPEEQIISTLRNQGVSPAKINEALNHARIKGAVDDNEEEIRQAPDIGQASIMTGPEEPQNYQNSEMPSQNQIQPPNQEAQQYPQGQYNQYPQEQNPQYFQEQAPANPEQSPQDQYQGYYPQTPQGYNNQEYYPPQESLDTETISEIAEQVVQEKFSEFLKKTGDIAEFKNSIKEKVSDLDDRLKRIESTIDKLQNAIIGRIGEFGESTSLIHKDLDNLHGTVSKLMNPLVDNYNELKKITDKK